MIMFNCYKQQIYEYFVILEIDVVQTLDGQ